MSMLKEVKNYLRGPYLYGLFIEEDKEKACYQPYTANRCERIGNIGVYFVKSFWSAVKWTSPIFLLYYCYKTSADELIELIKSQAKNYAIIFFILNIPMLFRGIGRFRNSEYREFQAALKESRISNKFDYDFSARPVNYQVRGVHASKTVNNIFTSIISRVALKIIYPGSTSLVNAMMFENLQNERIKLILNDGAKRFKIRTQDNNDIDLIFIDRVGYSKNGDTLVVVCEGNCGFYECGSMRTAIDAGYSVVGWNHPGFGGSTGRPFPSEERHAIEAVMEFVKEKFSFKNTLLYGWSIGGFTSSWAASQYPEVKGLILDATFDNILPLAKARVPNVIVPLAAYIIKNDINLDVLENVKGYNGPVTFIRRSKDEMICTEEGNIVTNRCNHLVEGFLKHRYPEIIDSKREKLVWDWLSKDLIQQGQMRDSNHVDKFQGMSLLKKYRGDRESFEYPIENGEPLSDNEKNMLTIHLLDTHLKEYASTHCVPLPVSLLREPTI